MTPRPAAGSLMEPTSADPLADDIGDQAGALVLGAVTALFRLADRGHDGGVPGLVERLPFLGPYLDEIAARLPPGVSWDDALGCWEAGLADTSTGVGASPIASLAGVSGPRDCIAVAMFALPVEDFRFAALADDLQRPLDGGAFAPATVSAALDAPGQRRVHHLAEGLAAQHVLEPVDSGEGMRVARAAWTALRDAEGWLAQAQRFRTAAPDLSDHWDEERRRRLVRPLELLGAGRLDTFVVRQVPGSQADLVVGSALGALGIASLVCTAADLAAGPLGALAAAAGAVPVVNVSTQPGEEAVLPRPHWYGGPLVVVAGISGGFAAAPGERRASLRIDRSDAAERERLWGSIAPDATAATRTELAAAFVLPDGHLRRIAAEASVIAELDGRDSLGQDDVRVARRELADHVLETRATRVPNDALGWDDLVVGASLRRDLDQFADRCRLREVLAAGSSSPGSAGARALLSGPSGCGKTLAGRVLGAVLGRDVHRVDLAAVVDKFVGETEKALDRLLSDAEQLDGVLLLDEGDTFLSNRTDVRSANDRYANLETNFLLQRLESYSGIVVVTTNAPDRIDSAFNRRMDATIAFGPPGAEERTRIWALHLPVGHLLTAADIDAMAVRHDLTGGQISNASQHARLLAATAGRVVDASLVEEGIRAEYRKAGALPSGRAAGAPRAVAALDDYIRSFAAGPSTRAGSRP